MHIQPRAPISIRARPRIGLKGGPFTFFYLFAMEVRRVGGVPTHVFFKRCKTESARAAPPLAVIIPGSPGMGHFYIPFACKLFELGEGKLDVSVVSHAGHSPGFYKNLEDTSLEKIKEANKNYLSEESKTVTDWYNLQDQVAHKMAFLEEAASNRDSIILIGHSIGCWMILQMLQMLPTSKVSNVFLLFPTIEKMALTPNAQSSQSYLWSSLRLPFTGLIWICSKLIPNSFKKFVLRRHFDTTPDNHLEFITQGAINIDEKSMYNILKMAKQEMNEVTDPPLHIIDVNIDKIVFYYGVGDGWNMEDLYDEMAARYPGKGVHLCQNNFPHAFVECASNEMAEYVYSKL